MFAQKPGKGITLKMYIRNTQVNNKKSQKYKLNILIIYDNNWRWESIHPWNPTYLHGFVGNNYVIFVYPTYTHTYTHTHTHTHMQTHKHTYHIW